MYTIKWYVPDRVILVRFEGEVTTDDAEGINTEAVEMLDKAGGEGAVHLVSDTRDVHKFPINSIQLRKKLTLFDHPSLGYVVTVTSNPLVRFFGNIIPVASSRFQNTQVVANMEASRQFLERVDQTLTWEKVDHRDDRDERAGA